MLITNQQYDLITNIDVEDGLINGAQCIIKYIETTKKDNNIISYIVYGQNLKIKIKVQIIDKNIHTYILQNKKIDCLHQ